MRLLEGVEPQKSIRDPKIKRLTHAIEECKYHVLSEVLVTDLPLIYDLHCIGTIPKDKIIIERCRMLTLIPDWLEVPQIMRWHSGAVTRSVPN